MDFDPLRRRVRGIVVFAVTPMVERNGKILIDEEGVAKNMEFLAQAHIPVVVVCGGVGELWNLSDEEHSQVVRAAVQEVSGRMVVFAGAHGPIEDSIRRARRIEEAGADGVLLFPDDDAVPTSPALLEYYTQVARSIRIGMMPFRADDSVSIEVLQRLADIPNVVALKEEEEDMEDFREMVVAAGGRISILGAGDALAPCYFVLGADGLACSLSNFLPELYMEMWEAAQRWDYRRVMEIHASLAVFSGLRRRNGISFLKAALDWMNLAGGPARSGRPRIQESDRQQLERMLVLRGRKV